jgi:hypothetical protein
MDPEAALRELKASIHAQAYSEAVMHLANYYRWRTGGGFEPLHGDARAYDLAVKLADQIDRADFLVRE